MAKGLRKVIMKKSEPESKYLKNNNTNEKLRALDYIKKKGRKIMTYSI